jgi:hypothetical protein
MELLFKNYVNTSTQFTVNANTATAKNVLYRDERFQFASDDFADDNTTVSMTITFDQTTAVDRIALVGHNLKKYTVFYNGATANTFPLESTANTTVTDYITNSAPSQYFRISSPVNVTSITIDMYSTIIANQNKTIGYLAISSLRSDFDGRVPSAQSYAPQITPQNIVHRMSDGGTRIQTLEDKWSAQFSLDFITETARDELKTIFDDHDELIFCAFGTTTGWDEVIFQCVWDGPFDFYKFSDNAADAGYTGNIRLLEGPL